MVRQLSAHHAVNILASRSVTTSPEHGDVALSDALKGARTFSSTNDTSSWVKRPGSLSRLQTIFIERTGKPLREPVPPLPKLRKQKKRTKPKPTLKATARLLMAGARLGLGGSKKLHRSPWQQANHTPRTPAPRSTVPSGHG